MIEAVRGWPRPASRKIFVTGSTGAIGRLLIPNLLSRGHTIIALVRTKEKGKPLADLGVRIEVADPFDRAALTKVIERSAPEVIVHQLTSLARSGDLKHFDEQFSVTNQMRTEVTDTLLAAARRVGVKRFIAQSFCGWPFARVGSAVKTEDDPLDLNPPRAFRQSLLAIRHLEAAVLEAADVGAVALRYGFLYGPGTTISRGGSIVEAVKARRLPLVGSGAGVWSFIHIADAVQATALAVNAGANGIYHIVDDSPSPVSAWLPALAAAVAAKPPYRFPAWLGRLLIGEGGVSMMTQVRGGSNTKAREQLNWQPRYPSWELGFVSGLN
jgi:nucleoside-diphosphate-sugar epimerase